MEHSVIRMEHKPVIAEAIKKQMDTQKLSDRALAKATGIPATTLGRKMASGGESFTMLELKRISQVLGVGVLFIIEGSA